MNATTESTGPVTAATSATRRPRNLEELLDREETLASQGIVQCVHRLGDDALDALNLRLHWRRKPLETSAIVGAVTLLLAASARLRRTPGLVSLVRRSIGTKLAGALASQVTRMVASSHFPGLFGSRRTRI